MGALSGEPVSVSWINHASFLYAAGGVRLVCDPWLSGPAFNNGWRHITPTRFAPEDFGAATHIWISHQHPDHFAPQDLRRIPAADRERLTVLYQPVPDKLVVSWLKSAGFKDVREMPLERWVRLDDDVEALSATLGDDAWLALRARGTTVLNVNDCVLKRRADVERIKALTGNVDVLLTQFSYAQWTGNPEDVERRRADAREKFERIRLQCEVLQPKIVVPFASYIYFSNRENFYMNDAMNRVGEICEFIESELGKKAVVLYPGETWRVPDAVDWHAAALRYACDMAECIAAGPIDEPRAVEPQRFQRQIEDLLTRLRAKNPIAALVMRERSSVYLTDQESGFDISIRGIRPLPLLTPRAADIVTSSDNVLYAFRMPWGANTLHVSGRFRSYVQGGHLRFVRLMSLLHYYNRTPLDAQWCMHQAVRISRAIVTRLARARAKRLGPATQQQQPASESTRSARSSAAERETAASQ